MPILPIRYACTNHEELVAHIAAHYGRGAVIDVIRHLRCARSAARTP
jgi:hypothetical protein